MQPKLILLVLACVNSLHVIQILDSVILEKDEYLQLSNFNEANFVSQDQGAFNQSITIGITNNFENFQFDIFVFEVDDEGRSADFDCYKQAVFTKLFNTDCNFGQNGLTTEIFTNIESRTYNLKSDTESNDKDRFVIIDNTPFPADGAFAGANLVLEYASSSTYTMSYNLRSTSIYMGIISMIMSFAIGMLIYLSVKIHKDIKKKFETADDEQSEEEEENMADVDL